MKNSTKIGLGIVTGLIAVFILCIVKGWATPAILIGITTFALSTDLMKTADES